jgi:hypothetical protein
MFSIQSTGSTVGCQEITETGFQYMEIKPKSALPAGFCSPGFPRSEGAGRKKLIFNNWNAISFSI